MVRPDSPAKEELKKGPWTREEDQKLLAYIQQHGHGSWRSLPAKAGLQRCGKSCRLRWTNYLRPDIKRGKFSTHEEKTIIRLHALLGNRWSAIAAHLPKRTDNEIKNYWNTRLKKRLTRMGIDPVTHKPKSNSGGAAHSKQAANLSHMAQWETARLEAEARLARESKIISNLQLLQKSIMPPAPPLQLSSPPCLDVLKVWQATSGASNNCFFTSQTVLESPTSTLNFSSAVAPAAVPRVITNDAVTTPVTNTNSCDIGGLGCGGNMDDLGSYQQLDYGGYVADAVELAVLNSSNGECFNPILSIAATPGFAEVEDTRNYWNELLNMVNSPMELPGF